MGKKGKGNRPDELCGTERDEKLLIGLAGEMRVCSELLLRGFQASITFGNAKATDIIITSAHRFLRVEVKTSRNGKNFVTSYYPKYTEPKAIAPHLWVFYLPRREFDSNDDRFFLLTHDEVGEIQLVVNKGKKTIKGQGCDNIPLKFLVAHPEYENRWSLVASMLDALT